MKWFLVGLMVLVLGIGPQIGEIPRTLPALDAGPWDPQWQMFTDLGPLSPLAMSPFFGVTVLSGMAQLEETTWGTSLVAKHSLIANNPVLKHPATFVVFLILTILTSLPRLTKVSKPIAQSLDWIESYSVLLITLILLAMSWATAVPSESQLGDGAAVLRFGTEPPTEAGVLSATLGALLLAGAVINFLVIKSVRFMFELLVWVSPIPGVDAVFEFANKSCCLGLLILYALSPWLALVVNLLIFAACLAVFQSAKRRLDYHWHLWVEPFWQWWFPRYRPFDGRHLWCFAEQDFGPFKRYDRLQVYEWEGKWMMIRYDWFWRRKVHEFTHDDLPYLEATPWKVNLVLQQQIPLRLATHRGYRSSLDQIASGLNLLTRERLDARRERQIQAAAGEASA